MMHQFLAQLDSFIPPDPPPLASPPLLQRVFLEQPLPLAALLVVAGFGLMYWLNSRGQARRALIVGFGLILAGGAVWLVGSLVTTRREKLLTATGELVGVTARLDEPGMNRLLAEDVHLFSQLGAAGFSVAARGADKATLMTVAREALRRYPVKEQYVSRVQAEITGPNTGRSQVLVRVVVSDGSFSMPHLSWWRIVWREEAGSWRATEIEPLAIPGAGAAQ